MLMSDIVSLKLRDSYKLIAKDYLNKKSQPWEDYKSFKSLIVPKINQITIDLGAANGRNLINDDSNFSIALELCFDLLVGFIGPENSQKVAGALPKTPFRKNSSDNLLCIAVLHHIENKEIVSASFQEMERISTCPSSLILSVWRRYRYDYRNKIFDAMKKNQNLNPLINHNRPWFDSNKQIIAYRFYHYYTFKELYEFVKNSNYQFQKIKYIGGKYNDSNIFAQLITTSG